jgi:hypothetical protein
MKFRPPQVIVWVILCTLAAALPAQATIMRYLEIEDLARASSEVFHGQTISTEAVWNAERTRIYTVVRFRVRESFKGTARRDQFVTVTQLGGEKDGIRMDYAGRPEFTPGESVVLFAARGPSGGLTVVALKQGRMHVEGGQVTRDLSGLTLLDSVKGGALTQARLPRRMHVTLDELRERVTRTTGGAR